MKTMHIRVLDLLSDGVARTTQEISNALKTSFAHTATECRSLELQGQIHKAGVRESKRKSAHGLKLYSLGPAPDWTPKAKKVHVKPEMEARLDSLLHKWVRLPRKYEALLIGGPTEYYGINDGVEAPQEYDLDVRCTKPSYRGNPMTV